MTMGYRNLKPEEVCVHKPEPNWFDVREAINEHFRQQQQEDPWYIPQGQKTLKSS